MLLDRSVIATQILKDSAMYFHQGSERVLQDNLQAPSKALIYLTLFETARVASKLTAEDQLFSRAVEEMIVNWLQASLL